MISPEYTEQVYLDSGEDGFAFLPKAGLSFSVNLSSYFALQTEFAASKVHAGYNYNNIPIQRELEFGMFEIPLLIMFRFPPDKVFSIYAGGVFQYRFSGNEYVANKINGDKQDDLSMPVKPYNTALAAGALFQIPVGSALFLTFDFRYTRSLESWIDSDVAELYFNSFHMALGLGVKF
jgi:hypothetical protein